MYCRLFAVLLDCGTSDPPDINSIMKIDVSKIIGFPESNGHVIVEGANPLLNDDAVCFGAPNVGTLEVKNDFDQPAEKSPACNMAVFDSNFEVTINYKIYCLSLSEQCCALFL